MTRNKTHALLLAAALVLTGALLASFAPEASARSTPAPAPQSQKVIKTHFVVMHTLYQSLQVRSLVDIYELHTFTYSPQIRDQMQRIFNAGGYQYGDKVTVWYRSGTDVALKIKGKPSNRK
ncbi:MAG TPA: hypothetical protein VK770_14165 [Candidatus Acidoferrum sp.]|jgi:hypothetical protein|nr:hypothetical protein [Candidatus Acidoferrum sp.]